MRNLEPLGSQTQKISWRDDDGVINKKTFAKLDYIITDSIFDGHSLNKNGFRFQFQLNKHRQFIKTKLYD